MAQTDSTSPPPPDDTARLPGRRRGRPAPEPAPGPASGPASGPAPRAARPLDFPPIPDVIRPLPAAVSTPSATIAAAAAPPAIGHNELRQALQISALREDLARLLDEAGGLVDHIETAVEQVRRRVAPLSADELADPDIMAPLLQFAVSTLVTIRDRARALDTRTGIADDAERPVWQAGVANWPEDAAEPVAPPPRQPVTAAGPTEMPKMRPAKNSERPAEPASPRMSRPPPPPPRPLTPQNPADLAPFAPVSPVQESPPAAAPSPAAPPDHPPRHAKSPGNNPLDPKPARPGSAGIDWLSPTPR